MTDAITIEIPMTPDRRLTPNSRGYENRWHRGPMIAAERQKAKVLTDSVYFQRETWVNPITVTVTIHWGKQIGKDGRARQNRRLDWDSATSICKAMLDGALVDTGIIGDDRQIQWGTVKQNVDKRGEGFTVIRIERAE